LNRWATVASTAADHGMQIASDSVIPSLSFAELGLERASAL